MPIEDREKPTALLKAFYDNLNLVNLFPLLESNFDVEVGGDNWKKIIGNYKIFGSQQKVNIPSFDMLNQLFDPLEILSANSNSTLDDSMDSANRKQSLDNIEELEKALTITRHAYEGPASSSAHGGSSGRSTVQSQANENELLRSTLDSISTKEELYLKKNVDSLFLHFIADQRGDVNLHILKKMHSLIKPEESKAREVSLR